MTPSHKFCSKRQAMFRGISKPIFSIFPPGLPSPLNAYYTAFSRPGGGLKRKKSHDCHSHNRSNNRGISNCFFERKAEDSNLWWNYSHSTLAGYYHKPLGQLSKVGREGLEPSVFPLWLIYSQLPSPLGYLPISRQFSKTARFFNRTF